MLTPFDFFAGSPAVLGLNVQPFDFGRGATLFSANVAALKGGKKIQIRLGSKTGTIIGTLTVTATGGVTTFKAQTARITKVTGVHDVYLTFAAAGAANLQSFKFA